MTLKEFINKTLFENGLTYDDTEEIENYITDKAREKEKKLAWPFWKMKKLKRL